MNRHPLQPRVWASRLSTNSLVRKCDRLEFAAHVVVALMIIGAVPVCLAITSSMYADVSASRQAQLSSRTQVTATLVAPPSTSTYMASARWTLPGRPDRVITGIVPVSRLHDPTSPIWVDRTTGAEVPSPADTATIWVRTINSGIATFAISIGMAAALWGFTTAWFARVRSRTWDAEWRHCSSLTPATFIAWTPAAQLGRNER